VHYYALIQQPVESENVLASSKQTHDDYSISSSSILSIDEASGTALQDRLDSPFDGLHLGGISSFNGVPIFSDAVDHWIQTRTGSISALRRLGLAGLPRKKPAPPPLADEGLELPDKTVVMTYFEAFCRSHERLVMPAVDRPLFEKTIATAYDPQQDPKSIRVLSAKACIFSYMSVLILLMGRLNALPVKESGYYARQVELVMTQVLREPSLDALQTCVMQVSVHCALVFFELGSLFADCRHGPLGSL